MRLQRSCPSRSRRHLTGVAAALPLLVAGALASPAQAAPASESVIVTGSYNSSGTGCQGEGTGTTCLEWDLRVPSSIAPNKDLTVTIEADSAPGQWTWNCLANDRLEGTAAYYDAPVGGVREHQKLGESGLGHFSLVQYGNYGDIAGRVDSISCTPEHLSITYTIDHLVRDVGSYLDLSLGTTTLAPGSGERTYSFSPTVTTSADNTAQTITTTVQKPAENTAPR